MASKKSPPKQQPATLDDAIKEQGPLPVPNKATRAALDELDARNRPLPLSLADIRAEALRQHANIAHTIADLEAWRSEIDATISFLKGR